MYGLSVFLCNNFDLNNVKQLKMNVVKIEVNGFDIAALAEKLDTLTNVLNGQSRTEPQTVNEDKLITRAEAAQLLSVTLPTIHSWTKQNILKPMRIGNTLRFSHAQIMETLANNKHANKA